MGIWRSFPPHQKHDAAGFLPKRLIDLDRVCYLQIININHSNIFINLQKAKALVQSKAQTLFALMLGI